MTLVIQEHQSSRYPPRTKYNATSADLTVALAVNPNTGGERLTKSLAGDEYEFISLVGLTDGILFATADKISQFFQDTYGDTINIAGNGIYTLCEHNISQSDINWIVFKLLSRIHAKVKLERVYTGGQTGADIAGAVAAHALGIPCEVTLPKGYIQRFEDRHDISQSHDIIYDQIIKGSEELIKRLILS